MSQIRKCEIVNEAYVTGENTTKHMFLSRLLMELHLKEPRGLLRKNYCVDNLATCIVLIWRNIVGVIFSKGVGGSSDYWRGGDILWAQHVGRGCWLVSSSAADSWMSGASDCCKADVCICTGTAQWQSGNPPSTAAFHSRLAQNKWKCCRSVSHAGPWCTKSRGLWHNLELCMEGPRQCHTFAIVAAVDCAHLVWSVECHFEGPVTNDELATVKCTKFCIRWCC